MQTVMANPAVRERLTKVDTDRRSRPAPRCKVKLENEIKNWSKFIDAKRHQGRAVGRLGMGRA